MRGGFSAPKPYNDNEGPMLGYGNKLQFSISKKTAERETYYVVPALGWTEDNLYERDGQTITLRGENENIVTFNNIDLTSGGHSKLYTKINVYTDNSKRIKVSSSETAGIDRSNKPMPSNLELKKQGGGSFLYVNNPEKITDIDIIQASKTRSSGNYLLYQQSGITDKNTLYVTHSTFNMAQKEFYYDVDFYNPSNETVTVKIKKPYLYVGSGYTNIRSMYLEYLWDGHSEETIEIKPWKHRLLYHDIVPNEFNDNQQCKMPVTSYIALFADFEVLNGKNITISTLAAYEEDNLNIYYKGDTLYSGTEQNESPLNGSPFLTENRANEHDLPTKHKGIDREHINHVIGDLRYVIDDDTEESSYDTDAQGFTVTNKDMPINNIDDFYPNGVKRRHIWVANINPLNDKYDARYHAFPSSLPSLTYPAEESGYYVFDFKHLNTIEGENGSYTNPLRGNEKNYSFKEEVLEAYREAARTESSIQYPEGVNQEIMSRAAQSHGSWGVKYTYNIDILNEGTQTQRIELYSVMKNFVGVVYYITDLNTNQVIETDGYTSVSRIDPQINDMVRSDVKLVDMDIPAKSNYRLTVTFLNGVGDAGFVHHLKLRKV